MISDKQYKRIINWELRHHKVVWFRIGKFIIWRSLTVEDVRHIPKWYSKFTMTTEQNDAWMQKVTKYLRKRLSYSDHFIEVQTGWLNLQHGLKIDDTKPKIQRHLTIGE